MMKKGLLSEAYPEKKGSKRIKSAPDVVVSPPKNLDKPSTPATAVISNDVFLMLQKPTSVSVSRNTNITLKALGSLGYGDTIDQTIDILVESFMASFSFDEKQTLESLIKSFKDFEMINFEKKLKNNKRIK